MASTANSNVVVLSVDGRSGAFIAAEAPASTNTALILRSAGINGTDGINAPQARPGEPGGSLAVEIAPAAGGIEVRIVRSQGAAVLPERVTVGENRRLLLSARGGDGGAGNVGGDGGDGGTGAAGVDATAEREATNGTNGGRGGNAGAGSHGGAGGSGGRVNVMVDERHTNLLLAVDWNVDGGKGGASGRNGTPGKGGAGGKGGRAYQWKEQAGFKYKCTSQCAYAGTASNNNASAILNNIARYAAENGAGAGALIPAGARARMPGVCKCRGGGADAHCLFCEKVPIMVTRTNPRGSDGHTGESGSPADFAPRAGLDGLLGAGQITVRQADGSTRAYPSKYSIELQSFQVVDENDDGVFEPGEHVFVHSIVVRNKGGMPTPAHTRIPVTVRGTDWIRPVEDREQNTVYLPTSIPPGHSAYLDGRIKALITFPRRSPEFEQSSRAADTVSLCATMPGLEVELPGFAVEKEIVIQYPLSISLGDNLPSVRRGSKATFSWQVHNHSTRPYGRNSALNRTAMVSVNADRSTGVHFANPDALGESAAVVAREITLLNPKESLTISVDADIAAEANSYSHGKMIARLHVSRPVPPSEPAPEPRPSNAAMQEIQGVTLEVQISSAYLRDPESTFLLVTNSETSGKVVTAWRTFIEQDLGLKVDIWNLSIYGSMENIDDDVGTILAPYAGKSVIMLCNDFEYFSLGKRTVLDFCEPLLVTEEVLQDTRIDLAVSPLQDPKVVKQWIRNIIFPICATNPEHGIVIPAAVSNASDIVESVQNQYRAGEATINAYTISLTLSGGQKQKLRQLDKEAQKTLHFLREKLPQERFCIKPNAGDTAAAARGGDGSLFVFRGVPHGAHIAARFSNLTTTGALSLSSPDRFACISTLPFTQRLQLLNNPHHRLEAHITEALHLSITHELYREVQRFLADAPWPDTVVPSSEDPDFLPQHLKCLDQFLRYYKTAPTLPAHALEAVRAVLEATHSNSLQQRAARVLLPVKHRRTRLRALLLRFFKPLVPDVKKVAKRSGDVDDVPALIAKATGQSRFEVESSGNLAAAERVASEVCQPEEWNRSVLVYADAVTRLKGDVEFGMRVLGERVSGGGFK